MFHYKKPEKQWVLTRKNTENKIKFMPLPSFKTTQGPQLDMLCSLGSPLHKEDISGLGEVLKNEIKLMN